MLLDLKDKKLRGWISFLGRNRVQARIEYPDEAPYRARIHGVILALLKAEATAMTLDLDEDGVRITLRPGKGDRYRLTIEYPRGEPYRDRVLSALGDLLEPSMDPIKPRGRPRKTPKPVTDS